MSEQNNESGSAEVEPQEELKPSTGAILKEAREKLGLSLEELSEQIRVPLNVLEAIEIDKVPKNLPETFIRGYIRSYARKVEVDEAIVLPEVETVAAINKTTSQSESGMQSFSRRTRRKASEKRLIYFSWFMVIAVIIAFVVWWLQDSEKSDYAPVVETQSVVESQTRVTPKDEEAQAEVVIEEQAPVEPSVEVAQIAEQLPAQQAPQEVQPQVQQAEQNQTVAGDQPVELTEEQKAVVADNGEPDESGFLTVEMKFDNECWVEVYDVAGERIAVGNKPAGYLMRLNAQGPLNVLLGNPVGVSVWVNGKVYDMTQYPNSRVARFELEAM